MIGSAARYRCVAAAIVGVAAILVAWLGGCRETPPEDGAILWRSRLAADSAAVGDLLTLEVTGGWPAALGPAQLAWFPPNDTLLLLARDSTAAGRDSSWIAVDYRLRFMATREGRFTVGPVLLLSAQGDTLASGEPHGLTVAARVAEPQAELRPLAAMQNLDRFPYLWAALGLTALLLALAALAWWSRRQVRAAGPEAMRLPPPAEEFEERLQTLLRAGWAEKGEMRRFVQELSWVLRHYLGRRWEKPAVEATRPEILRWLPRTDLPVKDQQVLAAWLARTDAIKFAGVRPLLAETKELADEARRLVTGSEAAYGRAHPSVDAAETGAAEAVSTGPGGRS